MNLKPLNETAQNPGITYTNIQLCKACGALLANQTTHFSPITGDTCVGDYVYFPIMLGGEHSPFEGILKGRDPQ